MIRAALLGLFCGAAVAATPLTRCVLALAPFERAWLARKGPVMTPEQLAAIRERVRRNDETRQFFVRQPIEVDLASLLAEVDRLRAGIEALHGAVQEFEPCPTEWKGCDDPACTESAHDGGLYHDDQPTGHVCLTCRHDDGEPAEWPCETAALLNPEEQS